MPTPSQLTAACQILKYADPEPTLDLLLEMASSFDSIPARVEPEHWKQLPSAFQVDGPSGSMLLAAIRDSYL